MSSTSDGYHLKFSIGKKLWTDLFRNMLPYKVGEGAFDALQNVREGVRRLDVKQRVRGLLEDRQVQVPGVLVKGKDAALRVWGSRREQVYEVINELVKIQGDWRVEVDRDGSDLHYAEQRLGVEAHVKGVVTGKVYLLRENVEFPFTLERRIGAHAALVDIRYDAQHRAIVGDLNHVEVDLGDNFILQLLNRGVEQLLLQQTAKFNPVPMIRRDQLEEMVGPAGGPLKLKLSIEDVALDITEHEVTLKVRFGFSQLQLEVREG